MVCAVIVVIGILASIFMMVIKPRIDNYNKMAEKYQTAITRENEGEYTVALRVYSEIQGFKDVDSHIDALVEKLNTESMESRKKGDYVNAIMAMAAISSFGHENEYNQLLDEAFNEAMTLTEEEEYDEAYAIMVKLNSCNYPESNAWLADLMTAEAVKNVDDGSVVEIGDLIDKVLAIDDEKLRKKLIEQPVFTNLQEYDGNWTLYEHGKYVTRFLWYVDAERGRASDYLGIGSDGSSMSYISGDYYLRYHDKDSYDKIIKRDGDSIIVENPSLGEETYKRH